MKKKIGHFLTMFVCIAAIIALIVLSVVAYCTTPKGPHIPNKQIYYDMRNMVNDASHTPTMQSVYQQAYDQAKKDPGSVSVIFHENGVTAEVQIEVMGTALGDVQICMLYDQTKEDHDRFEIYDYGYMLLDK